MYKDVIDLAKYIISKCISDGHPISNLQLQKILYYIQREFLRANNKAFPNVIEAWQFGPVVPDAYYFFCGSGSLPIILPYNGETPNCETKEVIDNIINEKRMLDPWRMVADTHKINGAWDRVYQNGKGDKQPIPDELIKVYG